jgi:hypothetical protein
MDGDRKHAQQLLSRLAPDQIAAVVHIMEAMLDPLSRRLADALPEGEQISDAEREAIAEADEWLKHNQPIPHEEVLAEFGLTMDNWEKMGKDPWTGRNAPA